MAEGTSAAPAAAAISAPAGGTPGPAAGGSTPAAGQPGAAPASTGAAPAHWSAGLDAESRGFVENKGFHNHDSLDKALPEILKAYRHTDSMVGRDKVVWPKSLDDANDPAVKDLYTRLGVPPDAKGYGIEAPEGGDAEVLNGVLEIFHGAKVPTGAAKQIVEKWSGLVAAKVEAQQVARAQQSRQEFDAVRQEWGNEADRRFSAAQHAGRALGLDQPTMERIETAVGTKTFLTLFSNIGMGMAEDRGAGSGGNGGGFMTPEAAASRKQELMKDAAWVSKYQAGDSMAAAEWNKLELIQAAGMNR